MSIQYEEMRVPSSDGMHTLAGRVYRPEGRVRGLFHVVHGMTEHIARYDPLFRRMAEDSVWHRMWRCSPMQWRGAMRHCGRGRNARRTS